MPLQIMLPMVVIGILGITLLLHVLGYSRGAVLRDDSFVRQQWQREFPDDVVQRITLAPKGNVAMVEAANGPGLVIAMGADTTALHTNGVQLTETDTGISLHFNDLGVSDIHILLSKTARTPWIKTLTKPEVA